MQESLVGWLVGWLVCITALKRTIVNLNAFLGLDYNGHYNWTLNVLILDYMSVQIMFDK